MTLSLYLVANAIPDDAGHLITLAMTNEGNRKVSVSVVSTSLLVPSSFLLWVGLYLHFDNSSS